MKKTILLTVSLFIFLLSNAQFSNIAQPDTVYAKLGEVININPTLNDIDTTGNPIIIDTTYSNELEILFYNDSIIRFKMKDYSIQRCHLRYKVIDTATIYNYGAKIYVYPDFQIDTIDANQIKAAIYPMCMQFWDYYLHNCFISDKYSRPQLFYPSDSLTRTYFNYNIWMGGLNSNTDSIHLAAERFRQTGTDF